jgi:hypothetical protein
MKDPYRKFLAALRKMRGEFKINEHGCIRHRRMKCAYFGEAACPIEALGFNARGPKFKERFGICPSLIIGAADGDEGYEPLRRRILRAVGLKERKEKS